MKNFCMHYYHWLNNEKPCLCGTMHWLRHNLPWNEGLGSGRRRRFLIKNGWILVSYVIIPTKIILPFLLVEYKCVLFWPFENICSSILTHRSRTFPFRLYGDTEADDIILVYDHVAGRFYALDAICSHEGGPLDLGDIEDINGSRCIVCPWHNYEFRLVDGVSESSGLQVKTSGLQVKSSGLQVKLLFNFKIYACNYTQQFVGDIFI